MGLKGNLATVSLADVFQVLSHGHSSGLLRIQAPDGSRFIEIDEGAISIVARSSHRVLIGDLLLARGLITEDDLQKALSEQKQSERLLGNILMDHQLVTREGIESAVRFQIEEEICELFMLKEAEFDFLANAKLDAKMALAGGFVRLKIDPNSMLLEAARRMNDWQNIENRIANQAMLFDLDEAGRDLLESRAGLSAEGMVLLNLVHDKRSVAAMVQKGCLGRINTNNMLIELWDANLIRPAAPEAYGEIARAHLDQGRISEAKRVAEYGLTLDSDAHRQTVLKKVIADADLKIEMATRSVRMVHERSEVIRRKHPALLIKRRKSPLLYVIVTILLLLGGAGGVSYHLLYNRAATSHMGGVKQLERIVQEATDRAAAQRYKEALEAFNFVFKEKVVKERAQEEYKKILDKIKEDAGEFLKRFGVGMDSGRAEEIEQLIKKYAVFEDIIPNFEGVLLDHMVEAGARLQEWQDERKMQQYEARFVELMKESNDEIREKGLLALLTDGPLERVAVRVRAELGRLAENRREAERAYQVAQMCEGVGDLTLAKTKHDLVMVAVPGSVLASKSAERIKAIDATLNQGQQEVWRIYNLSRRDPEKAGAELALFLKKDPDLESARQARKNYMGVASRTDEKTAEEGIEEANQLEQLGKLEDAAKKRKALVEAFSYTSAVSKMTTNLEVDSLPAGAEIMLNGTDSTKRTPATIAIPLVGAVRITIGTKGFYPVELSLKNEQPKPIKVNLAFKPFCPPVLMPFPASGEIVLKDNLVALVCGNEVAFWQMNLAPDQPLLRVRRRETQADVSALPAFHHGLFLASGPHEELEFLAASNGKRLWRINPTTGKSRSLGMESVPLTGPVQIEYRGEEHTFIGMATQIGLECFDLTSGQRHKSLCVGLNPGFNNMGFAFHQKKSRFFIPRLDGKLHAVDAETFNIPWSKSLPEEPLEGPVVSVDGGVVGMASAPGKVFVWNTSDGEKKYEYDLGGSCKFGLLGSKAGFVALTAAGKMVLLDPTASGEAKKEVWTQALGEGVNLAPVVVRERYIAVAHDAVLKLFDLETGQLVWNTPLPKPIAGCATDKGKIFVSTADAYLWVFDTE